MIQISATDIIMASLEPTRWIKNFQLVPSPSPDPGRVPTWESIPNLTNAMG
jgi:hypothetical protein